MANTNKEDCLTLSARGGALLLKGISLFLSSATRCTAKELPKKSTLKSRKKKMNEKEAKCPSRIFEFAKNQTNFTRGEIEILYKIYKKLISMNKPVPQGEKSNGTCSSAIGKPTTVREGLDRIIFREILHNTFDLITEDMIMDRIYTVLDESNAGLLTAEAWFKGLAIFLKGSAQQKLNFCFSVYDLNMDGFITKDEIFQLLRNSLIKQPQEEDPDEGVKDLVEIIMRKFDKDKDGKISLDDYRKSVDEEPLILEAFGRCLPDERACETFLSTIKG